MPQDSAPFHRGTGHSFKSLRVGFDLLKGLLLLLFLPAAHWRNTGVESDLRVTQWIGFFMKNQRRGHWLMSLSQSDDCGPSPARSVANFSGKLWSTEYSHAYIQNPTCTRVCAHTCTQLFPCLLAPCHFLQANVDVESTFCCKLEQQKIFLFFRTWQMVDELILQLQRLRAG